MTSNLKPITCMNILVSSFHNQPAQTNVTEYDNINTDHGMENHQYLLLFQ